MALRKTDPQFKEMCRAMAAFRERKQNHIGDAFAYLCVLEPEFSVWLMQLYGFFVWLGTVDCRSVVGLPETKLKP